MVNFVTTSFACAILVFGANALSDTDRGLIQNKIIDIARECFLEHKISAKDIISLRDFKIPSDNDVSCFLDCVFKKLKMVDNNGVVTPSKAKEAASAIFKDADILNNVEGLVSHCSSAPEKTPVNQCVGSNSLFTCLITNREKFDLTIKFKQQN